MESLLYWSDSVKRAIVNRNVGATGTEILRTNMGFKMVPTLDKKPIMALSDNGRRRPETSDPVTFTQWAALWPDLEIGLVPGDRFGIIDVDEPGTLALLVGLDHTFREIRDDAHQHMLVAVPDGASVRSQARLAG